MGKPLTNAVCIELRPLSAAIAEQAHIDAWLRVDFRRLAPRRLGLCRRWGITQRTPGDPVLHQAPGHRQHDVHWSMHIDSSTASDGVNKKDAMAVPGKHVNFKYRRLAFVKRESGYEGHGGAIGSGRPLR